MNESDLMPLRTVIGGVCVDFVCRCCFTKYGWSHQTWCEFSQVSRPSCKGCRYYDPQICCCDHPARKKERRDVSNEKNQDPV